MFVLLDSQAQNASVWEPVLPTCPLSYARFRWPCSQRNSQTPAFMRLVRDGEMLLARLLTSPC